MLEVYKLSQATEYLSQYKAVVFDLDDTLYSEKTYVKSGYAAIARDMPCVENMTEKLWRAFENGEQAIDFVLQSEGLYSPETVHKCLRIYRYHSPDICLYSEAVELLETLKRIGTHLGLITDGRPEGQRAKIQALNVEPYFEKIIITDELGGISFRKPHVAAFEEMQRFFGVPYEQTVYVGDNPAKDFIAPQKLGMHHLYFNNPDGLYSDKGV